MSKFFKALAQTELDRALRARVVPGAARPGSAGLPAPEATEPGRPPSVAEPPDGVDEHLVSLVAPAAFEAEQYRALRHAIEQMHRTADLKVIAVSSPGMGDGKSITAINLAGALGQSAEARVLLVDADLRRPALGYLLALEDTNGASLVGGIQDSRLTLDRIVQPRPPFNLSVICAGQAPPSPYEVFRSPRFGELLEEARRQYDFIVLDAPPLYPVQDCRVIGQWVDGVLLVVKAHRTPRKLLEDALTALDPAKLLGIVFNGADRTVSRYQSGYGYYHSPDLPSSIDHPGSVLKRAVRKVGDSLRDSRERSGSTRGPSRGGQR